MVDTSSGIEDVVEETAADGHAEREHTDVDAEPTSDRAGTGLDSNVAGALSYLLGPITGVLFYVMEPEDAFVRFHAAQSTVLFGGLFVASIVLSVALTALALVPVVGWIAAAVLGVGSLILSPVALVAWAFLMYKAYTGSEYEVPVVASYARRYATVE